MSIFRTSKIIQFSLKCSTCAKTLPFAGIFVTLFLPAWCHVHCTGDKNTKLKGKAHFMVR